jgi:hypothetical protein
VPVGGDLCPRAVWAANEPWRAGGGGSRALCLPAFVRDGRGFRRSIKACLFVRHAIDAAASGGLRDACQRKLRLAFKLVRWADGACVWRLPGMLRGAAVRQDANKRLKFVPVCRTALPYCSVAYIGDIRGRHEKLNHLVIEA